jgi:hypothetical protein
VPAHDNEENHGIEENAESLIIANQMIEYEPRMGEMIVE